MTAIGGTSVVGDIPIVVSATGDTVGITYGVALMVVAAVLAGSWAAT